MIEARNLRAATGEVDIVARDGAARVVVEVRTISGPGDPIDAVDTKKRHRVRRLGAQMRADRTDFLGIAIRDGWVDVHWVPG